MVKHLFYAAWHTSPHRTSARQGGERQRTLPGCPGDRPLRSERRCHQYRSRRRSATKHTPLSRYLSVNKQKTRKDQHAASYGKKTDGTVKHIFTNGPNSLQPIREGRDRRKTNSGSIPKQPHENCGNDTKETRRNEFSFG